MSALDALRTEIWALLSAAVEDRGAPWRTPVLSTIGLDGRPTARVLVLRSVEPDAVRLTLHTDARSPKAAEMETTPAVALTFWDPERQMQVRARGHANLIGDGDAVAREQAAREQAARDSAASDAVARAWAKTPPAARHSYGATPPPGRPIAAPDAFETTDGPEARAAFRIIAVRIDEIDWLSLAPPRHRRAQFTWRDDGAPQTAEWRAP